MKFAKVVCKNSGKEIKTRTMPYLKAVKVRAMYERLNFEDPKIEDAPPPEYKPIKW